jgi:nitrile hydratase beta subunit
MNGVHDMGGLQGFGPIMPESDEPVFHHAWERRAFALTIAMGTTGQWNIDLSRATRESLPPAEYLSSSYYKIWIDALERLLVAKGLVTPDELVLGVSQAPPSPAVRTLFAENVAPAFAKGWPSHRPDTGPPKFKVGDTVRTKQLNPPTHTRLPHYCRDKLATVIAVRGTHVFPDTNAVGQGEQPQWLYTVQFDATELWGPYTSAAAVCVDSWESYLTEVSE